MIICLTATIHPKTQKDYKASIDISLRMKEYISNVFFLLTDSPFERIVLCDNSNFSHEIFSLLVHFAKLLGKEFEYITFQWNNSLLEQRWRGAWEQEILEYFYSHSHLLKNETSFYKLTGRYRVVNIREVVACSGNRENIFFYMSPWHRRVSTAFFRVSKTVFQNHLSGVTSEIDDNQGEDFQIEWVYTRKVKNIRERISAPQKLPIFLANTGSGYKLRPNILKDSLKDILSSLWFYSV